MRIGRARPSSALGAAEPVATRAIFVSVEVAPAGTPRGRENWGGLPADADACLVVGGRDSVWRRGPTAGSRTVALSTPIRVPVPHRAPGQPRTDPNDGRRQAGGPGRRHRRGRSTRGDRGAGCRDRRGQGVGDGLHAGAAPGQAGPARHQGMAGVGHHQRHHRAGRAAGLPRDPTRRGLGPPPTTGGRSCICWKPAAWWCGW